MFGRRGTMSWFGDARSAAGAVPTTRLLQGRRVRRGWTGHLRSLLLRWHVDEDDGDLARVDAGSGLHNFDAPYLARQRCRGESASPNTYGDRAPFLVRRGAEVARRADRGDAHKGFTQLRAARMRKTLLLVCGLYCFLGSAECYSTLRQLIRPSVNGLLPPPSSSFFLFLLYV